MNRLFLGIDPGMGGGLCWIDSFGPSICPMPLTESDVWKWVREAKGNVPPFAVIEKVGGYVGGGDGEKGGGAANGSAMFKFGMSYGGLRMALVASGIPFEEVTPQKWQKEFGLHRQKGEKKHKFKARIKAKAQQLFPDVSGITLKTADALLLAEFARRKHP